MGTNYYLMQKVARCPTCGHETDEKYETAYHLGKSSAGWKFTLHIDANQDVHDISDIIAWCLEDDAYIEDEYGKRIAFETFMRTVFRSHLTKAEKHELHSNKHEQGFAGSAHPYDYCRHSFS